MEERMEVGTLILVSQHFKCSQKKITPKMQEICAKVVSATFAYLFSTPGCK